MSEKLNYDDVVEKLNEDGIMQEPDGPWLLEYIYETMVVNQIQQAVLQMTNGL